MAWYNFNNKKQDLIPMVKDDGPLFSQFSTPFGVIGNGDLTMPFVRGYNSERYVRFGGDNLYPQLINQLYYKSPLNGALIEYKAMSVIGGGFKLTSTDTSGPQKVKEYAFVKANNLNKLMRQLTRDLIMHGRVCFFVEQTKSGVKIERVGPEKVRNNTAKTLYSVSDDWSRYLDIKEYLPYHPTLTKSLYVYELDGVAGQDYYPIPQYMSASNWSYTDGEMAYLHKSNIINSIFPSFMIKLAKKFASAIELDTYKKTINDAKGAPNAGRILSFVANSESELPKIEAIPTNQNDKLFTQTDERIDANITRAHQIDPLIVGIRVSGKLGSGAEIDKAYEIFQNIVVTPLRNMMEEIGNDILKVGGLNSTMIINNYDIIKQQIIENLSPNGEILTEEQKANAEIRTAQATLRGSVGGVQAVLQIQQSYASGLTDYDSAIAMLENIFGFSTDISKKMLGNPKPIEPVDPTKNNPLT